MKVVNSIAHLLKSLASHKASHILLAIIVVMVVAKFRESILLNKSQVIEFEPTVQSDNFANIPALEKENKDAKEYQKIVDYNLFSDLRQPYQPPPANNPSPTPTPERKSLSSLKYTLNGVVIYSDRYRKAFISGESDKKSNSPRVYGVGDKIENFVVGEIYPDRVVLRGENEISELFLDRFKNLKALSSKPDAVSYEVASLLEKYIISEPVDKIFFKEINGEKVPYTLETVDGVTREKYLRQSFKYHKPETFQRLSGYQVSASPQETETSSGTADTKSPPIEPKPLSEYGPKTVIMCGVEVKIPDEGRPEGPYLCGGMAMGSPPEQATKGEKKPPQPTICGSK